jgi:hypothetical protein
VVSGIFVDGCGFFAEKMKEIDFFAVYLDGRKIEAL